MDIAKLPHKDNDYAKIPDKFRIYRQYLSRRDRRYIIDNVFPDFYNESETLPQNDDRFIEKINEKNWWIYLSNFMNNHFMGQAISKHSLVNHYADLYWGFNWADYNRNDESVEEVETEDGYFFIPKGLSNEDKFLCAIFNADDYNIVNSASLHTMFGWTKYECTKLRDKIPYIHTESCLCENGGYGGKAWIIDDSIMKEIKEEQKKCHRNCAECANVKREGRNNVFVCPISNDVIYSNIVSNQFCKYQKLDINESFNNLWKTNKKQKIQKEISPL